MANWLTVEKSAAHVAMAKAGNNPIYVGLNKLETVRQYLDPAYYDPIYLHPYIAFSTNGEWGEDDFDASYPPVNLIDGNTATKHVSDNSGLSYICFSCPCSFDFIGIIGTNFGDTIGSGSVGNVIFQIADDADFTTNLTTLFSWVNIEPGDNSNLFAYRPEAYHVATGSNYMRLRFANYGSGYVSVGQIVLGRYIMPTIPPMLPINTKNIRQDKIQLVSEQGKTDNYLIGGGRKILDSNIILSGDSEKTEFESMLKDTKHGSKHFYYLEKPGIADAYEANELHQDLNPYLSYGYRDANMMKIVEKSPIVKASNADIYRYNMKAEEQACASADHSKRV